MSIILSDVPAAVADYIEQNVRLINIVWDVSIHPPTAAYLHPFGSLTDQPSSTIKRPFTVQ